ncbi:MAG TPA: uroporphyrinogen-III C-methyltransferase [Candidatus Baltobacteraceae bacterium]|nr:uroporphyrinogen-III C-methyltransferase [Candidatus Baltobacteraceae bacterium]
MSSGRVVLVGAGPGDPGLLTLRAAEALARADVLLYDALAGDAVVALVRPSCERIFVGKRGSHHAMEQEQIEALMIAQARDGKSVVRLKGGDPFVFGRGGEEAQALARAGIRFEIVPGISSAIGVPAYAGIPITHRDLNPGFTVVTGHEDADKSESTLDWTKLADPHRTLVFLMAMSNLGGICTRLMENGLARETPVAIIADGTRPTQRTLVGTLASVADDVARSGLGAPAVVVVGRAVELRNTLRWFDRGPLFGKRVLITRPAHQAHIFARALYARGVEPILASTIAIVRPDDAAPAHRAIDELAGYRWVVFTSQNGVDAFFERLAALDADARYIGATRVAAIGAKTAERLKAYGVRPDLVPAAFISEEIARALIEATHRGERILIYRAQEARDVLPQMLEDAGREPHVVAAYKTIFDVDPEFAQKVARADVLAFTSASTVRGFAELLDGAAAAVEAARHKLVACIGPVTAQAADELGLHVDVVADVYTTGGLLDALEAHLSLYA